MFSFRARVEKDIARHIDASSVVGTWQFDWFVLSMRMRVILDSSFARPGSAPKWGGKKGEFRDWTNVSCAHAHSFARANDVKIVRSRNAQCKTRESP